MEGKSVVMSALGIGIGVGVGLGLASAPWAGGASASARAAGVTVERVEQDLRRLLVDGANSKVTFDEFPYYLRSSFLLCPSFCTYVLHCSSHRFCFLLQGNNSDMHVSSEFLS
jgi:hypothetical protein